MLVPPHSEQSYLFLVPRSVAFTCWEQASLGCAMCQDSCKTAQIYVGHVGRFIHMILSRAYLLFFMRVPDLASPSAIRVGDTC